MKNWQARWTDSPKQLQATGPLYVADRGSQSCKTQKWTIGASLARLCPWKEGHLKPTLVRAQPAGAADAIAAQGDAIKLPPLPRRGR